MIKSIFLDVDGCLTDGRIIYTSDGSVIKGFDVKDDVAIEAWTKLGKKIAIITGGNCLCVSACAKDLKIEIIHQGVEDKLTYTRKILGELNLDFSQCAAMGDYFNNKDLLEGVGLSSKPKGAHRDLKVDITLDKKDGKATVAQMIEYIIKKNDV